MTINANGTEAKDVAIHFIEETQKEMIPSVISKTTSQVKNLMLKGYTKKQLIDVIDYVVTKTNIQMYSFGYVATVIDDTLKRINQKEKAEEVKLLIEEHQQLAIGSEVKMDGESTERNRNKTSGFSFKPRFGKKFDFDLLKGN